MGADCGSSVMGRFPSSTIFNRRPSRLDFSFTSSNACDGLHIPGRGSRSRRPSRLRFKVPRFQPLPALRRNHDPGCVRRQALASVRGRRSGRQRYAWSKTIPECQSEGRARPQQGGSANKTHNAHHREPRPGEGTPVDRHLQARLFPPLLADCRWDAAAPIPSEAPSPPCA